MGLFIITSTIDDTFPMGYNIEIEYIDYSNRKIFKFDNNGTLFFSFGEKGEGEGQFSRSLRTDFDSEYNIYVSERGNHRIQKFDMEGYFIAKWGRV